MKVTNDAAPAFHTAEQIGPKRHMTPEGFLLCEEVPFARTGSMLYAAGEVPVPPGQNGYVVIDRDAETLFSDTTILSFQGKPVTNDHPPHGEVNAFNFKAYGAGITHNVRRGTGDLSSCLVADLLIMDSDTIAAVKAGKVEVSAGYSAHYERTGDGYGRQTRINGNHIALVEKGRCGPRCAIGDQATTTHPPKGKTAMAEVNTNVRRAPTFTPEQRAALLGIVGDESAEQQSGIHLHVHSGAPSVPAVLETKPTTDAASEARLTAMETAIATLTTGMATVVDAVAAFKKKPQSDDGEEDGKGEPTGDSKALESAFKQTFSDAEVLVPGFVMPTFDAASARKVTIDTMCAMRRRALDLFASTTTGKAALQTINGGDALALDSMPCDAVAVLFRAGAAMKRAVNNQPALRTTDGASGNQPAKPKALTIADLNEMNRKYHAGK